MTQNDERNRFRLFLRTSGYQKYQKKALINHENHHSFNVSIRNSFASDYMSKESYSPTLVKLYFKVFLQYFMKIAYLLWLQTVDLL